MTKRGFIATFIAVFALVAATAVQARVVHRVHVGGPDICGFGGSDPGCNANFSLHAMEFANGRVRGQWTDQFGDGDGFHAVIDCLSVSGNEAWVSGVITHGSLGELDLEGVAVATRVRDNGRSQNDPPDEISFSWIYDDTTCTEQVSYDLIPIPQGQVAVE